MGEAYEIPMKLAHIGLLYLTPVELVRASISLPFATFYQPLIQHLPGHRSFFILRLELFFPRWTLLPNAIRYLLRHIFYGQVYWTLVHLLIFYFESYIRPILLMSISTSFAQPPMSFCCFFLVFVFSLFFVFVPRIRSWLHPSAFPAPVSPR